MGENIETVICGLPWLNTQKTGLLMGVGEHAGYVASHIAARQEDLR